MRCSINWPLPAPGRKISAKLREAGDIAVDAQLVETILTQMMRDNQVIKREGGEWSLNPRAAKHV
jgi:hypothetical protein